MFDNGHGDTKMSIGSIQGVEAVKCVVFIWNYKAYSLSLKAKLDPNLYSLTDSQPKQLKTMSFSEQNET
jgi:hypothetical protein